MIAGALIAGLALRSSDYIPPLKIVGDVTASLHIQNIKNAGRLETISFQGKQYQVVRLSALIDQARPLADVNQLYLVGADGFTSSINTQDIDDCYITFTDANGWEAVNLNHPVNSNVKSLSEIIVAAENDAGNFGLNIISPNANLLHTTPGRLLTGVLKQYPYNEGQAVIQKNGKDYTSQIFTRRQVVKLSDLTPLKDGVKFMVMGGKGELLWTDDRGYLEIKDNYINYLQPENRAATEKVRGIIVNPPPASLSDAYSEASHYLNNGNKLLLIILDGLTYQQYGYASSHGMTPFLHKMGPENIACGVFPPEINVGLAAILTGKSPAENGIISGGDKNMTTPSILALAKQLNKKSLYLEGDQPYLTAEIQPVTVSDTNGDNYSDDELKESALTNMDKGYDFMLLRFHGINEAGIRCGELAAETMQQIKITDKYLEQIISRWPGKVIITADQGTRSGKLSNSSGQFNSDSMFVPYWRAK